MVKTNKPSPANLKELYDSNSWPFQDKEIIEVKKIINSLVPGKTERAIQIALLKILNRNEALRKELEGLQQLYKEGVLDA